LIASPDAAVADPTTRVAERPAPELGADTDRVLAEMGLKG
jgi:crotonobetainyl-CoA:carnitine CoA-transferase CaiB-like acyl-CoA transferase